MPTSLYISLGFFILYVLFLFIKKGSQHGPFRYAPGILYFISSAFFLYFAHVYWGSWWITLLTVLFLFIFMYAIQLPIGAIIYHFNRKRNQLE
jgi:hypothetical protein